jgi:putative transposase
MRALVELVGSPIGISDQCRLLGLPRSTFYHQTMGESPENLALMQAMDKIYTDHPYYGVRRIWANLPEEFAGTNIKRVQRLLRLMGVMAVFPPFNAPKTSISNSEHEKFPYLLRGLAIERPNQVWSTDFTYVPMKNGFLYLCAVIDWYSRFVLSWSLSNSMTTDFCIEALESALEKWGKPEIFNTDQGSQFTSIAFTKILKKAEIRISMDGKGRAIDNVFIERLWRTVKYEYIYLHAHETGAELYRGLDTWFNFYDYERKHQALQYRTPNQFYQTKNIEK